MYFVLMPDSLSSSWARQQLAEGFGAGVRVGTFNALLDELSTSALLPAAEDDFDQQLRSAAMDMPNAFWAKSLQVDEVSTLAGIRASLLALLDALPLGDHLKAIVQPRDRSASYYNDLVSLHAGMGYLRPAGQMLAGQWWQIAGLPMLEPITLVYLPLLFHFCPWQQQIIERLEKLFPADETSLSIANSLESALLPVEKVGDLDALAKGLFNNMGKEAARSGELQIMACRDTLEEAEVITGMLQNALACGLSVKDMAVVVPSGSDLVRLLPDLLLKAGIQSSHARPARQYYPWDMQLIRDLLQLYAANSTPPVPVDPMLMGSILVNPLMPWDAKSGQYYFSRYQRGSLTPESGSHEKQSKLLAQLLAAGELPIDTWLGEFAGLLYFPVATPVFNARSFSEQVASVIAAMESHAGLAVSEAIGKVIRQLQPHTFSLGHDETGLLVNGVSVLEDSDCLLMKVKHLFVAGFNQGNYEHSSKFPGVFDRAGWEAISSDSGLGCYGLLSDVERLKTRFTALLGRATQGITITLSRQAYDGSELLPSETLLDIARVFQSSSNVNPLELVTHVSDACHPLLAVSNAIPVVDLASAMTVSDLELGIDLTGIRCDGEGKPKPESPSSIEKMMVSPLAWLLDRAGLRHAGWEVCELDPALKGTIAHKVFELQFKNSAEFDADAYPVFFAEAVQQEAPFLDDPLWRMERIQLLNDIGASLEPFMAWCAEQGWELLHAEHHLEGEQFDIAVHGYVDAIFTNHKGKALILDYKLSKSDKFSKRMNTGYDLQTMLYREMFMASAACKEVANGYFALNDKTLVLDSPGKTAVRDISQATIATATLAQSASACQQVNERLGQLREGKVMLNTRLDEKAWQERGYDSMKYWLEDSPLLAVFMKVVGEGESDNE